MKVEIQHEKYGNVLYEEGFWLGRKSVSIKRRASSKNCQKPVPNDG